eukprot:1726141-Rhodomonas_salina.1
MHPPQYHSCQKCTRLSTGHSMLGHLSTSCSSSTVHRTVQPTPVLVAPRQYQRGIMLPATW